MPAAEHYHAEARYEGYPDDDQDRPYRDLDAALEQAEAKARTLRANGYLVEQTDTGNDDVGVIREYHAVERDGTPIAAIEVHRCQDEGHV